MSRLAVVISVVGFAPASAQTFANYLCGAGKPLAATFFPDERAAGCNSTANR